MNLPFERLQAGQYLPGCRTHGRYVRAELAEGMWRVFVGVPTMTQSELDAFRRGAIRFAAAQVDGCVFFLLRFGELPWERAALAPCAGEAERMAFIFADSDSGVAQEIRVVPLPEDAAAQISRACENLPALDRAEWQKRQTAVCRRYETAEDMLRAACAEACTLA